MTPLIERFKELSSHYHHGKHEIHEWNAAHRELFQLAQAIVATGAPSVQRELDTARKAIIPFIDKHEIALFHDTAFTKWARYRYRWSDFQITPEIHVNMRLLGTSIPRKEALRLIEAHRLQVRYVLELTRR